MLYLVSPDKSHYPDPNQLLASPLGETPRHSSVSSALKRSESLSSQPVVPDSDDWFADERYGYSSQAHASYGVASQSSAALASGSSQSKKSTSTPRKGKGKAKAAGDSTETPEKRGARYKSKCPQNILERVHRVRDQRLVYPI